MQTLPRPVPGFPMAPGLWVPHTLRRPALAPRHRASAPPLPPLHVLLPLQASLRKARLPCSVLPAELAAPGTAQPLPGGCPGAAVPTQH